MKQVLQDARTGEITVAEVPAPQLLPGCVLVRIAASVVSAGTERASAQFAQKSLLQKAKSRPDLVREVISKVQTGRNLFGDSGGAQPSRPAAKPRLQQRRDGDRCRRRRCRSAARRSRLPVRAPDLPFMLKSLAFHDCSWRAFLRARRATMKFLLMKLLLRRWVRSLSMAYELQTSNSGILVAVIGLGLLGQLTVQLLKAAGCRVLGMDIDPSRADLARQMGAEAAASSASAFRDLCVETSQRRRR